MGAENRRRIKRPHLIVTRSLRPRFPRALSCKQLSVGFADTPRQSTESWAWAWQAMRRRDTALGYKDPRPTFQRGQRNYRYQPEAQRRRHFASTPPPTSPRSVLSRAS
ncbi:hypothetical protein BDBG_17589 [Blastomyces gilchristii SLH14081]|uniref:Uncharacterized protein n=1 Tax=Blastomyces gilchristii (strain SLH14081) TaxID=559298 RepID=A0A179UVR3_BLAGS|nr:uncharacterized protein BDBG_17589 [Blastomyces gilchristii SLH14081]OAT11883.1 hypothetical protein BDBG_17589 [Blastomyces gilchristii SLH14081]